MPIHSLAVLRFKNNYENLIPACGMSSNFKITNYLSALSHDIDGVKRDPNWILGWGQLSHLYPIITQLTFRGLLPMEMIL